MENYEDYSDYEFGYFKDKKDASIVLVERIRNSLKVNDNMSLRELSRKTGLSESFINKLMATDVITSMKSLYKIAYVLDVHPLYLLNGLELHIKPKGLKIDKDTEIDELLRNYYEKKVEAEYSVEKKKLDSIKEVAASKVESDLKSIIIDDFSMNAAGISKNATLYYSENSVEIVNGGIYVIKYFNDKMVRRLWKITFESQSKYLLIPYSTFMYDYPILELEELEFDVIGKVESLSMNL